MKQNLLACIASFGILALPQVGAKAVFAHYMVGTVDSTTNHAATDIDQAIAAGFDAFALNVGQPSADWARSTIDQLFTQAEGKNFGLFFSYDFYGTNDLSAHQDLYNSFKDRSAYFKQNRQNVVSSYSGGAVGPDVWKDFKDATGAYLIPNPEADTDYYNNPSSFWQRWGGAIDGAFTWETAWPKQQDAPVNTSAVVDEGLKGAADAAQKSYVMGLSPLQYKRFQDQTWYRVGEVNLPERMTQILSLKPEFTEVITWNDAGESHYIGPCWAEGLGGADTTESASHPHDGWQPLISSFIDAFKHGVDETQMTPLGKPFVGAMWYRGVLTSCPGEKPPGAGAAIDAVNYAIVLPPGSSGFSARVSSNGQALATIPLNGGLNYNSIAGMTTGAQKVEVLDGSSNVVGTAASQSDVVQGGDVCNFNYYVAGLA